MSTERMALYRRIAPTVPEFTVKDLVWRNGDLCQVVEVRRTRATVLRLRDERVLSARLADLTASEQARIFRDCEINRRMAAHPDSGKENA